MTRRDATLLNHPRFVLSSSSYADMNWFASRSLIRSNPGIRQVLLPLLNEAAPRPFVAGIHIHHRPRVRHAPSNFWTRLVCFRIWVTRRLLCIQNVAGVFHTSSLRRQLLALAQLASQDDAAATRAYLPASRCFSYENDGFSNEAFALCAILKHIGCLSSAFTPTSGRAIALPVACLLPASNFRAPINVHNQNTVGASTSCYHTFVRCFRTIWRTQGTSRDVLPNEKQNVDAMPRRTKIKHHHRVIPAPPVRLPRQLRWREGRRIIRGAYIRRPLCNFFAAWLASNSPDSRLVVRQLLPPTGRKISYALPCTHISRKMEAHAKFMNSARN
ncbi:hypothetical protein C8R43DRAFT_1129486 [Mycena crocata]|nr:hypothetical protein C8R43DRAFT_1129486 [Mycena crocata]